MRPLRWLSRPGLCPGLSHRRSHPRATSAFLWINGRNLVVAIPGGEKKKSLDREGTYFMAIVSKPPVEPRSTRRIWRTPVSLFNWLFLGGSLLTLGVVVLLAYTASAEPDPNNDPFRAFGITAFV